MEPAGLLATGAQIAVSLAGFTGVVVAFGSGAVHKWPVADRFRLRLLLTTSVLPLVLCLFGLALLATELPGRIIWPLSSGLAAILLLGNEGAVMRSFLRLSISQLSRVGASRFFLFCGSHRFIDMSTATV